MAFGRRRGEEREAIPFNNSMGKLERLNKWWECAGDAKMDGLLDQYYNALENIYTEIYAHISEKEREEIKKLLKTIENLLDGPWRNSANEQAKVISLRRGSNLCDDLARRLSELSMQYKLEWFDIAGWRQKQKDLEPVVEG